MVYILVGPPDSGKSTQGKLLSDFLRIPHVSLGQVIRSACAHDQALCDQINSGQLLSPEYITTLMHQLAQEHPKDLIIDGAMRRVEQVKTVLELWGKENSKVIILDLSDAEIMRRATTRVDAKNQKRPDDAPEIVQKRINTYRATLPLILDKLTKETISVIHINGEQTIAQIQDDIRQAIESSS